MNPDGGHGESTEGNRLTLILGGSQLLQDLEFCGKTSRDIRRKGLSGSGDEDLSIYK